jgi:hypothetical protein
MIATFIGYPNSVLNRARRTELRNDESRGPRTA